MSTLALPAWPYVINVFLHCCPLQLLHLLNLSFVIGMPNRCCILELRVNQFICFVCKSFVCLGAKENSWSLFEIYEIC